MYALDSEEHWPEDRSLSYITVLELELFCKREEKCDKIPYVQAFMSLYQIDFFTVNVKFLYKKRENHLSLFGQEPP